MIFGDRATTRQALRRFLHAGGTVTLVLDGPLPDSPTGSTPYGMPSDRRRRIQLGCSG